MNTPEQTLSWFGPQSGSDSADAALRQQVEQALPLILGGSAHGDVARKLGISDDSAKKIVSAVHRAIRSVAATE